MKRIGYLNEEGSLVRIPSVGEIAMVDGEPYIVESVEGEDLNVLNEEESCVVNKKEIDEEVLEVTANENTGKTVDGMVCLGDTELGEAYTNESDEVFINEALGSSLKKVFNKVVKIEGKNPKYNDEDYWEQVVAELTDTKEFTEKDRQKIVKELIKHYSINEAFMDKLEGEMVYRDRKTNSPIVTGQLDSKKDTIMYWDVNGDHHTIKKAEFAKKFKAGKEEDFDLFESSLEEE